MLEKEVLFGFKSHLGSVLLQTRRCFLLFALSRAVAARDDLLQALWAHLDLNPAEKKINKILSADSCLVVPKAGM